MRIANKTRADFLEYPESFWRSLKHLNAFRIFLAVFFLAIGLLAEQWHFISTRHTPVFLTLSLFYALLTGLFEYTLHKRVMRFERQLSLQLLVDIASITLLMHFGGGIDTGLGLLLIVPLSGAGLFERTRKVWLMAAIATLAILSEQFLLDWLAGRASEGYVQAAMLSIAFFTVAGLSHLLAKGALSATHLAGEKAQELASLEKINARVIQDLPYGVLVINGNGQILQANPQASLLLNCTTTSRGDIKTCVPQLESVWRNWRDMDGEGVRVLDSGGQNIRLRVRLTALDSDRREGAVVVIEDLTELEQQAVKMKLAALGQLTANLAHEIRNPLSAINHAAQLLAEEPPSTEAAPTTGRLTRIIEDNVSRLNWLVEDVLALNRRDRVNPESIEAKVFVEAFMNEFKQNTELPEGLLQLDIPAELQLCFDRLHLHQILWNLCRNAVRHCRHEAGSIQIRAHRQDNQACLDIYNDGPSISPELQQRLFEPFFTTDKSGTGLGLYISRELTEANHGALRAIPQDNGALFRLACKIPPC